MAAKKTSAKKTSAKKASTAGRRTSAKTLSKAATAATKARDKLTEYWRKRDFSRTKEPAGSASDESSKSRLRFVIQKHAASHLHFDFRLELDGVMKSWAVPKGPSYDPAVKRLAMQVEDHPIAYNKFEGTIPAGEYGGGTVMLWDRGTYGAPGLSGSAGVQALRDGYRKGRLDIVMHGERMKGGWSLVRMHGRGDSSKPQWLLIKRHDGTEDPGRDVVAEERTSVHSGRTMEEIANGRSRVWHSNRGQGSGSRRGQGSGVGGQATAMKKTSAKAGKKTTAKKKTAAKKGGSTSARKRAGKGASATALAEAPVHRGRPKAKKAAKHLAALVPMKASIGTEIPSGEGWTFEPKYDGIRVIAYATADAATVVTRNGNDKSEQFPEVIAALMTLARKARRSLVLDGEIVALQGGEVARFQDLQSRMHTTNSAFIETSTIAAPAALVAFDLLMDGDEVLMREPWTVRRERLEQRLRNRTSASLLLGESVPNDGEEMLRKAEKLGWEGVIAKRMDDPYHPGERSRGWLKLKIEHRQEFVIGGWTEPRKTREHIGALLLGHYDEDGNFVYVGHTGGGFTREGLKDMYRRLAPLERQSSPFVTTPKTNEKAHWVTPKVVVEVKFGEWTAEDKLRQPIFLGVRDDKPAREVIREPESVQEGAARRRGSGTGRQAFAMAKKRAPAKRATSAKRATAKSGGAKSTGAKRTGTKRGTTFTEVTVYANAPLVAKLADLERESGRGTVTLGRGASLDVSSLDKVYFPKDGITKGTLFRYYATVAPLILPTVKDRALVLKRTPEGIEGETFFQQKAPDEAPEGVRVENVPESDGDTKRRLVGGDLTTLLYCVQLGCVSTDPWHSRVQSPENPDYTYLDLDPQPKAGFQRVLDVARWVKEELDELGLHAALKTSGSRGLHVCVPLPTSATWDTAVTLAQIIAANVAQKHPKDATITRAVNDRSPKSVYVDYLQNIRGKSIAGAYCVRAKPGATVSTPLEWKELTDDLDIREFTVETAPARFNKVGDLWNPALKRRNSAAALRGLGRGK
ncbi:MAG: DNA ligase D [Gemmatimonadaceae bacterium]|nr:DNA ligase D [Gemmatimonadaceae bacterium]